MALFKILFLVVLLCILGSPVVDRACAADNVKLSISSVEGSFLFGAVAAKKGFFAQEQLTPKSFELRVT
jgi:hypothetical protein